MNIIIQHEDVHGICEMLVENLKRILHERLLGVYLTGSLAYGDFDRDSSDLDFLIVLQDNLSKYGLNEVKAMHVTIAERYPVWAKRIEASYITKEMLHCEKPPKLPRLYVNAGKIWDAALYGNEWLLNMHALYEKGKLLFGIEPKKLLGRPIFIDAVKRASKNDFFQEWEPLLRDSSPLKDSHFQTYAVLTLCRILHRDKNDDVVSKKVAAAWVNRVYGLLWKVLIQKALDWRYGLEMNEADEILGFIRFTSQQLGNSD